jgi:outer membrane protein OmpA-like peptidoglycan-associated protein
MATKVKTLPKVMLALVVGASLFMGIRYLDSAGYLSKPTTVKSDVPQQAVLPEIKDTPAAPAVAKQPMPTDAAKTGNAAMKILIYAWNAHAGLLYANGGPRTTSGSLVDKAGADLLIVREDDNSKLQAGLLSAAKATKAGKFFGDGAPCVTIMGDGAPAFLAGANPELAKVSPQSIGIVVGSFGFSRGEDKLMGRASWKTNPKAARGALIAGVLRDGDWNIAMKWAGDNGIRNNPDETSWDPDALNWLSTDSYIEAAEKYVTGTAMEKDPNGGPDLPAGVCVERKVVKDGVATGEKRTVCVNGVVTWTPGDVTVAHKKGGLASIVSTKEYRSQMPNTLICVKAWAEQNRKTVEAVLLAAFEGADQVRNYPDAAHKAAEIAVAVYKEETPEYWEKYRVGVTEADKTGMMVPLGGSAVNNLNDDLNLYGLNPGGANIFGATYTIFGNILVQQYPKLYPSYPKVEEILDTSYVKNVAAKAPELAQAVPADVPVFTGAQMKQVVSKKSWSISFETGSAAFKPDALKTLQEISNGALVADELVIEIDGYTDNTGDAGGNMELSRRRATAVRDWLMKQSATNFPATRFTVVAKGQMVPVASNATEEGRSKNRRVDLILGVE